MKRYSTWLFFFLAFFSFSAGADEAAMKKYYGYTPEQVRDMPEKQRSSTMPMAYIFAAQRGVAFDSELLFGMQLNQLMYPGIHNYKSAVLAFQKDLGDSPTGVLTVGQINQLEYRADAQKLSRINFPSSFTSWKNDDSASVKGTVTILDENSAWPVNHNSINCYRADGYCEVRQIMLTLPDKKSFSQIYGIIEDSPEFYNVTRWTKDVIDAEFPSKPDSCRTTSLSLNFKTKEFFFITKNAGGNCKILGSTLEKLPKPRISQLVDGDGIFSEIFGKLQADAFEMLSSDFRKEVERVNAQAKSAL